MKIAHILAFLTVSTALQYPPVFDTHIFASFPRMPVNSGIRLLHSPYEWANGACLAVGIPRFTISNMSPTLRWRNESMVKFKVNNQKDVTCISEYPYKTTIHVDSDLSLRVRLTPYTTKVGFSLSIAVRGLPPIPPEWAQWNRMWLETVLFALVNNKTMNCTGDTCQFP